MLNQAINKIDRPEADIERTKEILREQGVQFEDVGGNVPCVPISALHGTNVDELIETVTVQAEVLQLSGDPKGTPQMVTLAGFYLGCLFGCKHVHKHRI